MLILCQVSSQDIKNMKEQQDYQKSDYGVYIKDTIPYITRPDQRLNFKNTPCKLEVIWLEIISSIKDNILVGVIHRHPKRKDKEFLQYLSNTLKKIKKDKKILLTGDFNLNLLKFYKNKEVTEFLDFPTVKWFTPQILGPTRITENYKTIQYFRMIIALDSFQL